MPKVIYTSISVIYNPNSTGSGSTLAKELRADLQRTMPHQSVRLMPTKYAGHAEQIAYKLAKASARPLIISASGDGGYHEVVNGLIRAQQEGHKPIAGLLPAGNANDHFHDVHTGDLAKLITAGRLQHIDLLKVTTIIKGKPFERYAHSYIGFGLTPNVGKELNKTDLHWYNEIMIVIKTVMSLHSIKIINNHQRQAYYSLIFSNVSKMSKVLSLSEKATNNDGKFEVTIFKRRNKIKLLRTLLKASTAGLNGTSTASAYKFKTIKPLLMQLDGEISTVDAQVEVAISIEHKMLSCII
jgi:diacylglycerol kinase (ATP)